MSNSASRYDTLVATFVGLLALLVSGYTAYVQRQQVRAQVYPIVQFLTGWTTNDFHVVIENKGMGPALIRNVRLELDGRPMHNWAELINDAVAPGELDYGYSSIGGSRALAPGETLQLLTFRGIHPPPSKAGAAPTPVEPPESSIRRLEEARGRMNVSICYCSTLGDCWMLVDPPNEATYTKEMRSCPSPTNDSFQ